MAGPFTSHNLLHGCDSAARAGICRGARPVKRGTGQQNPALEAELGSLAISASLSGRRPIAPPVHGAARSEVGVGRRHRVHDPHRPSGQNISDEYWRLEVDELEIADEWRTLGIGSRERMRDIISKMT